MWIVIIIIEAKDPLLRCNVVEQTGLWFLWLYFCFLPLEEEEINVIIALGQEVAQHAGGVATADLISGQTEVDALHKVPQLSNRVLTETPIKSVKSYITSLETSKYSKNEQLLYLSVTPGRMKNIQKWMPKTRMTWKMTFPMTVFLKYSARSTTIVPNWISTITRNASGTWSSDREEVMSAAAECFCR